MSFLLNPYALANKGTGYLEAGIATITGVGVRGGRGNGVLTSSIATVNSTGGIVDAGRLFAGAAVVTGAGSQT